MCLVLSVACKPPEADLDWCFLGGIVRGQQGQKSRKHSEFEESRRNLKGVGDKDRLDLSLDLPYISRVSCGSTNFMDVEVLFKRHCGEEWGKRTVNVRSTRD